MKLSQLQFEQLLKQNKLVLSFVGMSNIGKTYWSKKLQGVGFRHFNCDGLIEEKLAPTLRELDYSGIEDVSRWMGQPYDKIFVVNQNKYLSFEREVMEEIFAQVKNGNLSNTVIDTTGSVIHTGKNFSEMLKQYSMVIYIEASKNMKEKMFEQYWKEPKPVVFGNVYGQEEGETNIQALSRCYRKLLDLRSTLYSECADVIIPHEAIEENMPIHEFISFVKHAL